MDSLFVEPGRAAVPIVAVTQERFSAWLGSQPDRIGAWLAATNFKPEVAGASLVPDERGAVSLVVLGLGRGDDVWATGNLAKSLPKGCYRLGECLGAVPDFPTWAALAWALGAYSFTRYRRESSAERAKLLWPEGCDRAHVERTILAATLTRDLVNTPAADMLPDRLEQVSREIAGIHGGSVRVVAGDDLIENYPMIHAVGRASAVAPRLIDLTWGDADAPKVTLVGKGVCFDSGGLDLKAASAMSLMKKDMGGAATLLGLARMLMMARLRIRLRLLIPAVENAVSGSAYRPGDILRSRKGLTVEIGNTDAEGRLILADALAEAAAENPTLLIDCATLTGACRTALGPDLPGLFTEDETLARDLLAAAQRSHDPLWRLPLWLPYRQILESKVADITNKGDSPYGGAITAALFLREFVKSNAPNAGQTAWAHIDLFAWNLTDRPGRPQGGEAMAQRALFDLIKARVGGSSLRAEQDDDLLLKLTPSP